jgi:hypothetical protein
MQVLVMALKASSADPAPLPWTVEHQLGIGC